MGYLATFGRPQSPVLKDPPLSPLALVQSRKKLPPAFYPNSLTELPPVNTENRRIDDV
jgi:hypothetical protein